MQMNLSRIARIYFRYLDILNQLNENTILLLSKFSFSQNEWNCKVEELSRDLILFIMFNKEISFNLVFLIRNENVKKWGWKIMHD